MTRRLRLLWLWDWNGRVQCKAQTCQCIYLFHIIVVEYFWRQFSVSRNTSRKPRDWLRLI